VNIENENAVSARVHAHSTYEVLVGEGGIETARSSSDFVLRFRSRQ